jgi:2-octaprenyl-6-methoxyphenol hydroxylase
MKYDVAISGAGIPGLSLALLLGRAGLDVCLIDFGNLPASTNIKPGSHTAAIMADSLRTLEDLGVWKNCAPHSATLETLTIIDDNSNTPVTASFEAKEIEQDYFGKNIANNIVKAELVAAARKCSAITIVENGSIKSIDQKTDHFITINLADNKTLTAKILVGADGRNSVTRELAGIDSWEQDYEQSALTCLISHTKPHNNTSTEFHRPGGPFTLVPLPGKTSSVVWVEKTSDAQNIIKLSKQDFAKALQSASKDLLGKITVTAAPSMFPLKALKAKSIIAPRIALIAEAAHVITPLGAQGLNLSLRDAQTLYDAIYTAAKLGQDIGRISVLKDYERQRHTDINARVFGTHGLNKMVSNHSSLLRYARHSGLRVLDSNPSLRKIAMQLGMTGKAFSKAG